MKIAKTVLKSLTLVFSLGALGACGFNQDPQRIFSAHEALNKEHRFVVTGLTEDSKDNILKLNPSATYRVLSKNLSIYEITGVEKEQIEELSGDALVEKNEELQYEGASKDSDIDYISLAQAEEESPQQEFLKGCIRHQLVRIPQPGFEALIQKDKAYFQPGDKIKLTASSQIPANAELAWLVMPPKGSGQEELFSKESELELEFKMAGGYKIAVFYKTKPYCNYTVLNLNPTQNPALDYIVKTPEPSTEDFYHLEAINLSKALESFEPKENIVVAICDSGVNYNHPSLRESIWINPEEVEDGFDNDGNGYVDDIYGYDFYYGDERPFDDNGHGTHVAGLISGFQTGAAYGVAQIMPLKIGAGAAIDRATIVECICYAIQKEAYIINLSMESARPSKAIEFMIERAQEKGILVVAASGNGHQGKGLNLDSTPRYPAAYETSNILSVGASDEFGELTSYSNFGETSVDIVAPGGYSSAEVPTEKKLLSAYIDNPEGILLIGQQGTSMATPLTVGAAALYMSENIDATPEEVISSFVKSGSTTENLRGKVKSASLLDINAALSKEKSIILSNAHL